MTRERQLALCWRKLDRSIAIDWCAERVTSALSAHHLALSDAENGVVLRRRRTYTPPWPPLFVLIERRPPDRIGDELAPCKAHICGMNEPFPESPMRIVSLQTNSLAFVELCQYNLCASFCLAVPPGPEMRFEE